MPHTPDHIEEEPVVTEEPVATEEPTEVSPQSVERTDFLGRKGKWVAPSLEGVSFQAPILTEADQSTEARREFVDNEVHGFGSFLDRAVISDNILHQGLVKLGEKEIEADESFKWTGETWGKATKNIPEHLWHELRDAKSQEEVNRIRGEIEFKLDIAQGLETYGGWGTVGRFGLAVIDPAFLAAMVATEGVAGFTLGRAILASNPVRGIAKWGNSLGTKGRAAYKLGAHSIKTGARVGVGMGGVTALSAGLSPVVSKEDVPQAMLDGAIFGAGLGVAGRAFSTTFKRQYVKKEGYKQTREQFNKRNKGSQTHEEVIEQAFKDNLEVPESLVYLKNLSIGVLLEGEVRM